MNATALRVNRAIQNVGVRELANRIGVSEVTLWRWESGRTPIPPKQAERVLRALYEQSAGAGAAPSQATAR